MNGDDLYELWRSAMANYTSVAEWHQLDPAQQQAWDEVAEQLEVA